MAKAGRPKSKPINRYIKGWLEDNHLGSINEAAIAKDIPQSTLDRLADIHQPHKDLEKLLEISDKMGVDPGDLIRGILRGRQQEEGRSSEESNIRVLRSRDHNGDARTGS